MVMVNTINRTVINITYCGMCFRILGQYKMDLSQLFTFPEVEDSGMVLVVLSVNNGKLLNNCMISEKL